MRTRISYKEIAPGRIIIPSFGELRVWDKQEIIDDLINPYGFIYIVTNILNDKRYVGQTIRNPFVRFQEHIDGAFNPKIKNSKLQNAIVKYGEGAFESMIQSYCFSREELDLKEMHYIYKFKTMKNKYGYNMPVTNGSRIITSRIRKYLSKRVSGNKNPMYGTSLYQIWKNKYGTVEANKKLLLFKHKQSVLHKGIKKEGLTFLGRKHSQETKNKMSLQKRGSLNPMYRKRSCDI